MAEQSTHERIEQAQRELENKKRELEELNTQYDLLESKLKALIKKSDNAYFNILALESNIELLKNSIDEQKSDATEQLEQRENDELSNYDKINGSIQNAIKMVNNDDVKEITSIIEKITKDVEQWNPSASIPIVDEYLFSVEEIARSATEKDRLGTSITEINEESNIIREQIQNVKNAQREIKKSIRTLEKTLQRLLQSRQGQETLSSEESMQRNEQDPLRPLSTQEKIDSYSKLLLVFSVSGQRFEPSGTTDEERLASVERKLKTKLKMRAKGIMTKKARYSVTASSIAERLSAAYSDLIEKYFNSDYQSFISSYGDYLDRIGMHSDVKDSLIKLYSPKLYNAAPPPAVFIANKAVLDSLSSSGGGAFYDDGCIFICSNNTDWSGHRLSACHEAGHYFDNNVLRGAKYDKRRNESSINKSVKSIVTRLKKRGAKFRLFGKEFTLPEWKAMFITNEEKNKPSDGLESWINREIQSRAGLASNSIEVRKIRSQILSIFQGILGFEYGSGHSKDYNEKYRDTYIEAIANIVSMICNGYDFMGEPLSEIYNVIYKEIK